MTRSEAPETLEGWYIQHDMYTVDWPGWRALAPAERESVVAESAGWLAAQASPEQGMSAFFSVLGQKADILAVHFRPTLEALNGVELGLRQTGLFPYLRPAYSYLSVVELGLYEVLGVVNRKLAAEGLEPGVEGYDEARERELATQKEALHPRLYPAVPNGRYVCFYPMDKKRGETHNWYAAVHGRTPAADARPRHGGAQVRRQGLTQIISGSVGFDDWEWGVTLFADDPLVFKKLIYEMRFDPASSHYALFGGFYVGIRFEPSEVGALLSGRPPA